MQVALDILINPIYSMTLTLPLRMFLDMMETMFGLSVPEMAG